MAKLSLKSQKENAEDQLCKVGEEGISLNGRLILCRVVKLLKIKHRAYMDDA